MRNMIFKFDRRPSPRPCRPRRGQSMFLPEGDLPIRLEIVHGPKALKLQNDLRLRGWLSVNEEKPRWLGENYAAFTSIYGIKNRRKLPTVKLAPSNP